METFFGSSVPVGGSVEIWSYPDVNGTIELYYSSNGDRGIGFAVKGAVY